MFETDDPKVIALTNAPVSAFNLIKKPLPLWSTFGSEVESLYMMG